ncbi:MAG TPA: nucleotide exchange factor GrpE [Anaerolineae bacterium]|nr:nucleotide exchange factor GrpE [Anaerolineae bacterium]
MAASLILSNLLSLLEVHDQNRAADVFRLCEDAEALRRRQQPFKAIEVAKYAERLSYDTHSHNLNGIALLYLSLARLSSNLPSEAEQAVRDCERAITAFHLEPHNDAIARIFRARLDLCLEAISDQNKEEWHQAAFVHFRQAAECLQQLVRHWTVRGNRKKVEVYQDLYNTIHTTTEELSSNLAQVTPLRVSPKRPRRPKAVPNSNSSESTSNEPPESTQPSRVSPPIDLGIPTRLYWPDASKPIALPLNIPFVIFNSSVATSDGSIAPTEELEINEFAIAGRSYTLRPLRRDSENRRLSRLRCRQSYIATWVPGNEDKTIDSDEYVLVRLQDQLDKPDQEVVIDQTPDGEPGARYWIIRDGSESSRYDKQDLRIIGIIEAVLTPCESMDKQINELLTCVDDLHAAEGLDPAFEQGLAAIRDKFYKHFAKHYNLQPIPIVPGTTVFDPNQGHHAIGFEHVDTLDEGVILSVFSDGYYREGKVFREAKVIVNQ